MEKLNVYQSIAKIQGLLAKEGISKDRKNQQQGFAYRSIDQVYSALSPLMSANNLCILPRIIGKEVVERTNSKGTALFYTTVTAEFDIVSAIDGSTHTVRSYGEAMDSGDKSIGKAMSYAYKAMAFMLFAIPTEGDNDPDSKSHELQPIKNDPMELKCLSDFKDAMDKCGTVIELEKYAKERGDDIKASLTGNNLTAVYAHFNGVKKGLQAIGA